MPSLWGANVGKQTVFSWPFTSLKNMGAFKTVLERKHFKALSGKEGLARFKPKLIASQITCFLAESVKKINGL